MERSVEGDWHNSSDSKSSRSELKGIGYYQYVAETEKKDMKIYPHFGSSSNLWKQIPSLDISEHKRWCCANYAHKIGDDEGSEDKIKDAFVNADGNRVDETNNIATEMMLGKKCLNQEVETNIPVDARMNKGIKIPQKKRNMFQKNDCGFEIDTLDGKSAKKSKASMENIATNSCSRDNGYDRHQYCLLSDSKSVKSKCKKHDQQAQVVSGCSLHFPLKEKNSDVGTNTSSANIFIQGPHASPSVKKVDGHLKNANISLHTKKDCDSRNLFQHTHDSSHMNVVLQRGNFSKGEDVLQKSIGTGMMTSHLESELYLKEKLFQTLNNFKNAQKNTENGTIQKKSIPYYPSTISKGNESCYPLKANRVESNQSFEKGVIPIERQPIMVQSDQSSRNGFTNLHHTIDLTNKQEICTQNQTLMEMSDPTNIYGIQDHPYGTIPQRNQQTMKVTERGSSIYLSSIDNMEMFRNRHEQSNPLIQNGMLPYINPLSTNFHPLYTNAGFLRSSTAITQFKEQPIKLSNSMQVSSISTRWGLQNVERSNPVNLSIAQDTTFQSYNLQNQKCGQVSLRSLEKGKTISDLKSVHSIRGEDMRTKGQGVSFGSQKKKMKAHALEQFDGTKLQESGLSSGLLLHTIRDSGPKDDLMQNDNISRRLDLGGYNTPATVLPVNNIPKKDPPCLLNQNPADIVDVDYERYFRTAEDQSIRDSSSLQRKILVNIKLDESQRQRRKERPGRMPIVGFKS